MYEKEKPLLSEGLEFSFRRGLSSPFGGLEFPGRERYISLPRATRVTRGL